MTLKVYGHPLSTCARKVLTTLAETNTPHEFVLVDLMKGEHKQPAHMARQPFGQVPAIDDDGFALYESRAICRYIDDKAGRKLSPGDARGRAVMEQWISIETSNFTPHAMKFIFQHVFQRPQESSVLENAQKQLDVAMPILDAHLAKNPFFAGSAFSLADISFMPYFEYAMATPLKATLTGAPHVAAWWNKVSERPSWRKVAGR